MPICPDSLATGPKCLDTLIEVIVRPSRRVTVGDRSFATAGPRIWNTLPRDVTTATSLLSFRRKLKTHLFRQSYPDIVV